MKLTADNYYSRIANYTYCSVSQYKEATKVEEKEPDNKPMPDEVRMKLEELYNSLGGEKR